MISASITPLEMDKDTSGDFKTALKKPQSYGFAQYRTIFWGKTSFGFAVKAEILTSLLGSMPGAAGLFLRSKLYPSLFASVGKKLLIGRNVTIRHPQKIRIGNNVIIDDNCVIDAKGETNHGITMGDNVFIGRNTNIYCKNGDIFIGQNVNLSASCIVVSSNKLTIREGTVIGAFSHLLSGGEYDYTDKMPFCEQRGIKTKGELVIGRNCWIGAGVTVLDGSNIGDHCVIGAGAVVTTPIPKDRLAVGVPAKVVKAI